MLRKPRFSFFLSVILGCLMVFSDGWAENETQEVFTDIYANKAWGTNAEGEGHSGGGSTLDSTKPYRQFLQKIFKVFQIRSVVDVGCGDWEFSKAMDWEGIDYYGYDVVESVIAKNNELYENEHIHFIHANGVEEDLLEADLLICKDVLQHLSNEDILAFLEQAPKFKYCLITNDTDIGGKNVNYQINRGESRPLDLTEPPFSVKGIKVFHYGWDDQLIKQVLLIIR